MMKKQTKYFATIIVLLATSIALSYAQYQPTGACTVSGRSCVYRYSSTQRSFDGDQLQVSTVTATVVSQCVSDGVYGGQSATRYCIRMRNVRVGGDIVKDDSLDEVIDPTEEDIPELDPYDSVFSYPPTTPEDKLTAGQFCFVQTADGKIAEVSYPDGENSEAVNFKKGIVAAFQTNFLGTTETEEEDTTSLHKSAYRYSTSGTQTTAYRTIQSSNVHLLAGGTPTEDVQISASEQVVYDGSVLARSSGSTSVNLTAGGRRQTFRRGPVGTASGVLAQVPKFDDEAQGVQGRAKRQVLGRRGPAGPPPEPSSYDANAEIKEMHGDGEYTLVKVYCNTVSRSRRHAAEKDLKGLISDTLRANVNTTLTDLRLLETLRHRIPSAWEALETLHSSTGQDSLADRLHQLVALEGEYQPPSGVKPAIQDVISYLEKLLGSDRMKDKQMRSFLYLLLATEGHLDSQTALLTSYYHSVDKEERNGIITHIAFTRTPRPDFVTMVKKAVDPSPTSVDPLLLAFGALASDKKDEIQAAVVKHLIDRLEHLESTTESNEKIHPLIHIIHALGNTDSKHSIQTILKYLNHDDLDIQLASINALKAHSLNTTVQERLESLMYSAQFQEQIEGIVQMLIEALDKVKDKESHNVYVDALASVGFFEDSKLHTLVSHYLQKLGTDRALELDRVLRSVERPVEEDAETYDIRDESDARVRRGSDWDASNSLYDLVASYYSRKNDVINHPKHKAYIWGKKFGLSKVYAQIAAGGFAGLKPNGNGYKLFGKVIAQGHAFGKTATALTAEFLRQRTGSSIYQKIYAKVVGKTLINEAGTVPVGCNSLTKNLYSTTIQIFKVKFSVFIYVGTLDFYIGMTAKLGLKLKVSVCETTIKACASLIPSLTLRAEGGASATILLVVRGGVEVAASFTYQLEPEICIHFCKYAVHKVKACVNVYHGWPNNYAELYAFYQIRKVKIFPPKFYWGPKKRWSKLTKRWDLPSVDRRLIWSSCDSTPSCPGPIGPPGPSGVFVASTTPIPVGEKGSIGPPGLSRVFVASTTSIPVGEKGSIGFRRPV